MSLTAITVLIVPKNEAHAMQSTLKRNGLLHKAYRSSPAGQNGLEIPLGSPDLSLLPESILSRLVEVDSSESEGQKHHNLTANELNSIPAKWLKYGDILVLFGNDESPVLVPPNLLLEGFRQTDRKLRCIVLHRGAITGELRKPYMELYTAGESTETVHIENGVKFKFDVMKIMFAPGNGTERKRFGEMRIDSPEIVVDMFAGLGYFTIPFVMGNKVQNLNLNGVDDYVTALYGDNRELGSELLGTVDRIFMGYLPNTIDYVPRALQLAKKARCVLHYHHLSKKEQFSSLALEEIESCLKSENLTASVKVLAFSKVKSYAPQLFHCCADVELTDIRPLM